MAQIVSRTINSIVDKRIAVTNQRFARAHGIAAADWTRLRMGVRWAMQGPAIDLEGTPNLSVGFCNGTSNIYPSSSLAHAVYMQSVDSVWSSNAGSSASASRQYFQVANSTDDTVRYSVGASHTNIPMSHPDVYIAHIDGAQDEWASALFIELEKTAVNGSNLGTEFTVRVTSQTGNSSSSILHVGKESFLLAFEVDVMADIGANLEYDFTSISMLDYSATAVAIDEATNGAFDSVFVSWNRTTWALEVSDIAVAIMDAP